MRDRDENELEVIEVLPNEEPIKNGDKEIFAKPHYALLNDWVSLEHVEIVAVNFSENLKIREDEGKKNNCKKKK